MSAIPGSRFRDALNQESPLQIVGTINAYCALLAKRAGFRALYLSGAGVANASYGIPDLGMTHLDDVLVDAMRITTCTDLPLLVDIDTGWGDVGHSVSMLMQVGVAAVHLEDQVPKKRCGHRPNKQLVETTEMVDRIKSGTEAKGDTDFFIMARTDALASEGLSAAIERAKAYVAAGADGIFAEAVTELSQYRSFCDELDVPVLANVTEFGQTPLYSLEQLKQQGVAMALYPLSAFRAMSHAADKTYSVLREKGSQVDLLDAMQDRDSLYEVLDYKAAEAKVDQEKLR